MDQLQPYLDYFAAHPVWALILVFLVSLGEALLVIGLFVPSTAVLVGAGTLIGAGKLPFWPIMTATILGCIAGDQLSFWAGRIFGDRLRSMWPLRNYPHLLAKGEAYVKEHGGKSIAIGRFVPGIKSVVPGIAGMFGMGQLFFLVVNITSGIAWAAIHVLPGVLLGQALSLAGELSGRLLIVLMVLLGILAIGGWLVRVVATSIAPYRKAVQGRIAAWAKGRQSRSLRRFGMVIAPENPNSILLILLIVLGFASALALGDLVSGLLLRHAVSNFDQSVFNFFSELRSVPGDEIFIRATMFGDELVLLGMGLVPVLWFAALRNWRAAAATALALVVAKVILVGFSFGMGAPGAGALQSDFRFPSAHALEAGTVFGILAVITARGLNRWNQALIVTGFAMAVTAISFSRLYLGVNWLSDVAGGVLIAGIISVLFSVALATINLRRFRPLQLLATAVVVLFLGAAVNIQANIEKREERYQPIDKLITYSMADYMAEGWSKMPGQRINLVGRPVERFAVQWVGSVASLRSVLAQDQYKLWNRWSWRDTFSYLNPNGALADMAPKPAVHEGLRPKITATHDDPQHAPSRIVLKAFQSNARVKEGTDTNRVYLLNFVHESLKSNFGIYALPATGAIEEPEVQQIIEQLAASPQVEKLAEKTVNGQTVLILRPKS
ncbi:MAG: VTT domain-containing protein [Alphaproteobacteria bacterium]|nr:VTT domain-containing protein [Alphaproteobacteria bacterium]